MIQLRNKSIKQTFITFALAVGSLFSGIAQSAEVGELVVNLQNLRNLNQGQLYIVLYKNVDQVDLDMRKAYMLQTTAVQQHQLTVNFNTLTYGDYAVAAFHDMNNDGMLNTSLFGGALEDVAISNNAKGSLFSGPAWDLAKVSVKGRQSVIPPLIMNHRYRAAAFSDSDERGQ